MAISDSHGIPIAIHTTSATPHEVTLVEDTLKQNLLADAPERLIGDGAYDSDPLDRKLAKKEIKLIAPHKSNRVTPPTQDGREFRRYKRRWKIERLFAWLNGVAPGLIDRGVAGKLAAVKRHAPPHLSH